MKNEKNVQFLLFEKNTGKVFFCGNVVGKLNFSDRLILEYLIDNPNEIVSREVLLGVGWPSRIVVPNSLNISMRNIRAIFNICGYSNEPETIPKKGFKLSEGVIFHINQMPQTELRDAESNSAGRQAQTIELDASNEADIFLHKGIFERRGRNTLNLYKKWIAPTLSLKGYLFLSLIFCVLIELYIEGEEPDMVCSDIEGANFCGADSINADNITIKYHNGEKFWFVKGEDGYAFFKIE